MTRNRRLSILAAAIVAAGVLTSLAPVTQREANAGPLFRASPGGGYYYNGGNAPTYGGYSGFGNGPYGYNGSSGTGFSSSYGYADVSPGRYVAPSYRSYGLGNGFGTGGTYRGMFNHSYTGSRSYVQPDRPVYNAFGYGGYGGYSD